LNIEEEESESLFRYLDADKDGCVSFKEFVE
jgi:Ca2+-binding EF-hand superfamily protein